MTSTVICLPLPPSVNGLFAGQKRRYRSKPYETWIVSAGWELKRQRPVPVPGKVHLAMEVAEPKTQRLTDLDNRWKAVSDLLVTHGIIEGDDQRFVRRIVLEWSSAISGVRITISPYV